MESTARVELDRTDIARAAVVSIGDVLARVPNIKVQSNSRGEQVFALRGSDQRQVALTLDGAPLVSAWDGQLDLSLLPTSAIQHVAVTRGAGSVMQGPNALFGAVNVVSRRADTPGLERALTADIAPDWHGFEAFIGHMAERHGFSAAAGWHDSDGYEAGGESELVAGSDSENRSAVLGWTFEYGAGASTGVTLLAVDNGKGVVPERTSSSPRFWRYPFAERQLLIWYGRQPALGGDVDYSFHLDRGESRIDQYTDATFSTTSNVEDGRDRGGSGRVQWNRPLTDTQSLSLGVRWSRSEHLFRERASSHAFLEFSQVLAQVAAEWRNSSGPWTFLLGGAYDHFDNPESGWAPRTGSRSDWAATSGVNYVFDSGLAVDLTLARKTRFPSLRESYNGALGRFVANPDLGAETAHSVVLGIVGARGEWTWETRLFSSMVRDGIARASLPNGRFTRVNQTRSRILGVELGLGRELNHWLQGRIEGTLLQARARSANHRYEDFLEYRPGVNLAAGLTAALPAGWRVDMRARYVDEEYGLSGRSVIPERLPGYLLWNVAVERTHRAGALGEIALALRLDNVADRYYETQWGLPGVGRRASLGITWTWQRLRVQPDDSRRSSLPQ